MLCIMLMALLTPTADAQESLKVTLQLAMSQSRQAILAGDLSAFLTSIDPLNKNAQITEQQWQQLLGHSLGKKMLLRGVPDLTQDLHFLALKTENNWAAYYTETGLEDDNYQTLSVFLFHYADDQWRPAGKSHGLTRARPGGEAAKTYAAWSGRQQMLTTIETDQKFTLEQLIPQ